MSRTLQNRINRIFSRKSVVNFLRRKS